MDRSLIASAMPIIARSRGLVLREWEYRDVPCMVTMFNAAEMDRWTPLTHPFDADEAVAYVERARQARVTGTLQLAITEDVERLRVIAVHQVAGPAQPDEVLQHHPTSIPQRPASQVPSQQRH